MNNTAENATEIRPFRVDIPDEAIADLRRRIYLPRSWTDDPNPGVRVPDSLRYGRAG